MATIEDIEPWLAAIIAPLDDRGRDRLARRLGQELRRANAERIAAQVDPEGQPFAPRKPRDKAGRIARKAKAKGKMFRKIARARFLRVEADPQGTRVGFTSSAARIARVHHLGLRDRVARDSASPEVVYAARRLLGMPPADRARMIDLALAHLTAS